MGGRTNKFEKHWYRLKNINLCGCPRYRLKNINRCGCPRYRLQNINLCGCPRYRLKNINPRGCPKYRLNNINLCECQIHRLNNKYLCGCPHWQGCHTSLKSLKYPWKTFLSLNFEKICKCPWIILSVLEFFQKIKYMII